DEGSLTVVAPPGAETMTPALLAVRGVERGEEWGPFAPAPLAAHVPIAAELSYRFSAEDLELDSGYFATGQTHVTFNGRTSWGDDSRFAFHVTSRDWQE